MTPDFLALRGWDLILLCDPSAFFVSAVPPSFFV
jgi:hypothetical protein